MITSRKVIDKIEILEYGHMQVREATVYEEDGKELFRKNTRRVLTPGRDDTAKEPDARLKAVADVVWTPEVLEKIKDFPLDLTGTRVVPVVDPVDVPPVKAGAEAATKV